MQCVDMRSIRVLLALFLCICLHGSFAVLSNNAYNSGGEHEGESSFKVRKIQVNGLYKIKKDTFLDASLIKVGDYFSTSMSSKIIKELYRTGFYESIRIAVSGNTLIFDVVEKKTIANIKFYGNKEVASDMFSQALKSSGLIKGRMFDYASLEAIEQSLKAQYSMRGRKNVVIETKTEDLPRNRVAVEIIIDEGDANEIRHIRIIGNKNISAKRLKDELPISNQGLFTYFTKSAEYSGEKVNHALEIITHYYQDRGYPKIKVVSHSVNRVPNYNHVNVTIKIDEGDIYTIKGTRFAGNLVVPENILQKYITVRKGDVYSRKEIFKIISNLSEELNEKGYTFSVIEPKYEFDDKKKEILITFYVNPGRAHYVRRVIFIGNHKTSDAVLRREMLQLEGALYSVSRFNESIRKIRNLRYVQDVQHDVKAVLGTNNQVDIIVTISESHIAEIQGQAGYAGNGPELKLGVNHHNVFGNGKSAGFNFQYNNWGQQYSLDYHDPYFSESGISQSSSVSYTKSNTKKNAVGKSFGVSAYTMNSKAFSMGYSIPLTSRSNISIGATVKHNDIVKLSGKNTKLAKELDNYVNIFGDKFTQLNFNSGYSYQNYDQFPFPNSGMQISLGATINRPLSKYGKYYKLSGELVFYQPLFKGLVLGLSGAVKYADTYSSKEKVPFFEFYRAGGANYEGQVRGFEVASLGPRDSNGEAMGGNLLINGTAALIFPEPLSGKSFRTSLFFDIGNVYQTYSDIVNNNKTAKYKGAIDTDRLRYSVGVGVEWITPFGPIRLSFAYPLNKHKNDNISIPALSFMSGF